MGLRSVLHRCVSVSLVSLSFAIGALVSNLSPDSQHSKYPRNAVLSQNILSSIYAIPCLLLFLSIRILLHGVGIYGLLYVALHGVLLESLRAPSYRTRIGLNGESSNGRGSFGSVDGSISAR